MIPFTLDDKTTLSLSSSANGPLDLGLFTLTAATTTATAMEEWVTLNPMEVFTWRPAAKATSIHRVQYNSFFSFAVAAVSVNEPLVLT